jgi:ABC-type transport system involved in multi-copper enzyme maturation permease subunit
MLAAPVLLFGLLHTWLTPFWLLSVGVAIATVILAAIWGLLYLVRPAAAEFLLNSIREGILLPITYLAFFLTGFAVLGVLLIPGLPYRSILDSVWRAGDVGTQTWTLKIPAETASYELKDLQIRLPELWSFTVEADRPLTVNTNIPAGIASAVSLRTGPGEPATWNRPPLDEKRRNPLERDTRWIVSNTGAEPATLTLVTTTDIEYPQAYVVPLTALALLGLVAAYVLLRWFSPRVSVIALTTAREAMNQPLFYLALAMGSVGLLASIYIPYNTFGEDIKMLKSTGLIWIKVWGIFVAVWAASVSVSEEVEGRTALTVLSKPVKRRQFIFGKFLGVLGPVLVLFVVLGTLFLLTISFKVVYDARETAKTEPMWQLCYLEMVRIVPGLVLAFFETVVFAAISVAISTRLPMLANLIICSTVYVLGHLVPMLVNSSVGKFEIVRFVGQFIATVLPVLDHFDIEGAVAASADIPLDYLGVALIYCALYSAIAILIGLAMFEDRDLA